MFVSSSVADVCCSPASAVMALLSHISLTVGVCLSLVGDSNVAIATIPLYAVCVCVLHQAVDKLLFSVVVVVFIVVVVVVDIDNDVIQTAGM